MDEIDAPPEENLAGDVRRAITLGEPRVISSRHPIIENYEVFFEDDGETGYFYALDYKVAGETPIQDAALVYQQLKPREVQIEIRWSINLPRAVLICDQTPQVVFAFDLKKCWSRSNFPAGAWGDKSWSDDAWEGFEDIRA